MVDTRSPEQSYLNLYPDQACRGVAPDDRASRCDRSAVPAHRVPATLMLMRLRFRLAASVGAAGSASASALSVWPICADLLLPYTPPRWYFEQLFLARRLLLVAAVTIIPSSSLYLPLVLFSIIQLSALQQHWARPYVHARMNHGELVSQ